MKIRGTTINTPLARHAVTDDTAVSRKPWSSKHTIDTLCPAFIESGSIVSCEPVESYPLEVVSHIETAANSAKLTRLGKNLLTFPYLDKSKTTNGITITVNDDGSVTMNGTATAEVLFFLTNSFQAPAIGEKYTISGCPSGGSATTYRLDWYGGGLGFGTNYGGSTVITPTDEGVITFRLLVFNGATVNNVVFHPQLELGATVTPYEPYRELGEVSIDFGRTVNGGSFNWNTGVLTDENGATYQLNAHEILGLSGTNTLYSDTGDTTVSGRSVQYISASTDSDATMQALINHAVNKANPHGVTAEQVGAAPGGYGLGGIPTKVITLSELDNIYESGWYWLSATGTTLNGVYFNYGTVFVHGMESGSCKQEIHPLAQNCVLKRYAYGNNWQPWECPNPPLASGVEYRTTERIANGIPIYITAIEFGALPNASSAQIVLDLDIENILSIEGNVSKTTTDQLIVNAIGNCGGLSDVWYDKKAKKLGALTTSDLSDATLFVILKYIK